MPSIHFVLLDVVLLRELFFTPQRFRTVVVRPEEATNINSAHTLNCYIKRIPPYSTSNQGFYY